MCHSLYNTDKIEARIVGLISKYEFKVSCDDEDDMKQNSNHLPYTFADVTQFNIPVPENEMFITQHLFCRPTHAKGNGFIHIKSFNSVFGGYTFDNMNTNEALHINQMLEVEYVGKYPIGDGTVSICSASDIVIDKKGGINANECGLDYTATILYNNERNKEHDVDPSLDTLVYGTFVEQK
eukprot:1108851_1